MARREKDTAVVSSTLGLYLNESGPVIPSRALRDGRNFRIKNGLVTNRNVGWVNFNNIQLDGPVMLIYPYRNRADEEHLIIATLRDLYRYVPATNSVLYITPIYAKGTADVTDAANAVVTIAGENLVTDGIKVGDQIAFSADENDPDEDWYTITDVDFSSPDSTLVLDGSVTGAPLSTSAYTIRRVFTGSLDNNTQWEAEMFIDAHDASDNPIGDLIYLTNGVEPIVKWNGTDVGATRLDSLGFTARRILVYSNMLIAGNLVQGGISKPNDLVNSNIGQPENFSSGLAEQFRVHSSVSPIVRMDILGEQFAIYNAGGGTSSVILSQFVGDPFIFVFREVVGIGAGAGGHGVVAPKLVVNMGDHHLYLGKDQQYRFDGSAIIPVAQHIWPVVLSDIDPSRLVLAHAHYLPERGDIIWAVPFVSDSGFVNNYRPLETAFVGHPTEVRQERIETPHSRRDFPFTAFGIFFATETLIWSGASMNWEDADFSWGTQESFFGAPLVIAGDLEGRLWRLYRGQSAAGGPLTSFIRYGRRRMDQEQRRGLVSRIYPFATNPNLDGGVLNVFLHSFEQLSALSGDRIGPFPFDLNNTQGTHFVAPYRRARAYAVEFHNSGSDKVYELDGYDVEVRKGGKR
jgi:hypothetical protein